MSKLVDRKSIKDVDLIDAIQLDQSFFKDLEEYFEIDLDIYNLS